MAEDKHVLALTPEERNFSVAFDRAVECHWKEAEEGQEGMRLVFAVPYGLHQVYEKMMHGRDEGYANGAKVFQLVLADKLSDRTVRSHVLTRLALSPYDGNDVGVAESGVAWFGRFTRHLVPSLPQLFVEWCEDMASHDPHKGFFPQSTALIRGVLFAPAVDQTQCVKFWEAAAASPKFPMRIFSDPCASKDGSILSSYQQRTIRVILENVSEEAVRSIGQQMRTHLLSKMIGSYEDGRMVDRSVDISPSEQRNVLDSIASAVDSVPRRALISEAFGL